MKIYILIFLIISALFLCSDIGETIHHADTYYWLGIGEHGDMEAFKNALDYLEKAESKLNNANLPEEIIDSLHQKIMTLREDIIYQQDMAHDTFFGVFPLNRIIGSTIFSDAGAYGSFEFIDDPDVIAVCNGAEKVVETLNRSLKYSPQYGVVINSNPPNPALENEVRYIFNLDPRFFVHTSQEIASALTLDELKKFKANEIDTDLITHLSDKLNNPYLAKVTISQVDIIDDIYFFILEADMYWDNEGTPKFKMAEMSFCRDRREAFIPLWITNIALFILTLLVFLIFYKNHSGSKLQNWIMPVLAFFWGRLLPWLLNPLLLSIRPKPETLVKLSFWWLIAYGIVLICGTMLTWYLISKRARTLYKALAPDGWTDIALISVGFGLSAYFGETILIYDTSMIIPVIMETLITVVIGYILGSALDCTKISANWFIAFVLLISGSFGLIIAGMIPWAIYGLGIFALVIVSIVHLRMKKGNIEEDKKGKEPEIPELVEIIVKPQYQKFVAYMDGYKKVSGFESGVMSRLLLVGPSGRGKTAAAEALIAELKSNITGDVIILRGECPDQEAHLNPYAPLQQALGKVSGINFSSVNRDDSNINSIFDSLMDSMIPFSSLLMPGDEDSNGLQSRDQLNNLMYNSLVKMCKKSRIILFLDDLQWVDDATKDFLIFINEKLGEDNQLPLLLLLTSRSELTAKEIGFNPENIVMVNPLHDNEKELILSNGLGFEPGLSHDLLAIFGNIANQKGEMFFLLSTLGELAREGAFIKGKSGFALSKNYKSVNQLPIPDSFADSVMEQMHRISEEKIIVECAACIGLEFEVEILAISLEMTRLELLCALNKIETKTNIIYDVGEFDDIYAFSSSAVLEVLRTNLKIYNYGPLNSQVPQIIREFHARLATVLMNKKGSSVFTIANHFYAAGKLHTDKAIEYCIKSAHSAAGLFQHENARKYLAMAKECAEITGRVRELEGEFLQLEISESLVTNERQEVIANKALRYMEEQSIIDDQLRLLISKCLYNAGLASGDQKYFAKAVDTASQVANTTKDEFIKAESNQIVAISLPRNRKDEIISSLKSAYSSLQKLDTSMRTNELLSRIENSLAEKLTYGNNDEKLQAEKLFLHSIKIKKELMDKPGLARSWGGLGRLYLENNKIQAAKECFENDLELCRQIGDKGGEVKMYSFIADCHCRKCDYRNASESYENSFRLSENITDRLFAARGLIIVGLKSQTINNYEVYAKFLTEHRQNAISAWSGFFDEIITLKNENGNLPQWLSDL
jgi:tetratricopeptide (TPR) repeat protein